MVTIPVGPDAKISLYNNAGSIQLVADSSATYLDGNRRRAIQQEEDTQCQP